MELKDLFDLLHDPIQGFLTIIFVAYADKLADKIKNKSNKRTANACQLKDGSKHK
ncbi:hypothetical protein ACPC0Q_28590 [Bacillus bombysepticus]|uniref:hypothetical protein n=1 Tax=Bacillus cereus group TaxID=86661 RepID=UPI00159697A6|nr:MULTISPECIES: hypothetical protein [Bacillus cereus group]MDA4083519.1 hypothetical protein [Bacillus cereus]MEB9862147.1 hypothetical protein [Bacillus cereus]HDR4483506.1 hypothetical protein [Bacillus cereus]HDX9695223.1 hypothetical protein [Bacillus thuringiensis]